MAAPATKTIENLTGKWLINKTLSDSTEPILALQGIGWVIRSAIGYATVTQLVKQYKDVPPTSDDSAENPQPGQQVTLINIDQILTGGLKGTAELRALDWTWRSHSDWLFGSVRGRSRYGTLAKILEEAKDKGGVEESDASFLTEGWLSESGGDGNILETFVENKVAQWTAWQVWGFSELEGQRWFTKRIVVRRTDRDEVQRVRMFLEWLGELKE